MFFDASNEIETKKRKKIHWDKIATRKTLWRILRYSSVRILSILLTISLGLYLTLMIINLGGYLDEIMRGQIAERMLGMSMGGAFADVSEEEREETMAQIQWQMEEAMGLHEPLAIRTGRWWFKGITLQWGDAERLTALDGESRLVRDVIFSRLPYTLLLVGVANVILFFLSLWVAMVLSTQRGKFWDRLLASLTPISSAPSWVHGVILLAIFALELRILPFKGIYNGLPPETIFDRIRQVSIHMVLPVTALVLSVFFQGVYTWRTFFMVHSGEDYVELAVAKGLPNHVIRRRYLLRPTLPSVITSFAMMLISFWEGAIALELLFEWPGIGMGFFQAIYSFDRPVVVGIVVMFAYLLGFSVIFLDVLYALIDPRVHLGGNGVSARMRSVKNRSPLSFIKRVFTRLQNRMAGLFRREDQFLDEDTQPITIKPTDDTQPVTLKSKVEKDTTPPQLEETQQIRTVAQKPDGEMIEDDELTQPVVLYEQPDSLIKNMFRQVGKNIFKYPMAAVGLVIIMLLVIISIVTVIAIPYDEAVAYWHDEGFLTTPRLARPLWTNLFRREKMPESFYFDSRQDTRNVDFSEERVPLDKELTDIRLEFDFEFIADAYPQDLVIFFDTTYDRKAPFVSMVLLRPDGQEFEIDSFKATDQLTYSLNRGQINTIGIINHSGLSPIQEAFGDPGEDYLKPLKGHYTLQVLSVVFEVGSDVEVEGTLHGKVYGLFGTDNQRRDLTIAMLWGTPVALTFGIVGAVVTTVTTILIAAFSAWYGGILDEILQRITELNIILPALPIAVLVYILYSKSIWVILAIMILMNIFGNSLKEYRAMFMQFKESPYIEAAMAYGASDRRIIFKYMLPRIIQVMVPQLVISVPSFVFLEATLAYLGVVTPYLPTWGKVINMALHKGVFWGIYFWVMIPIVFVMVTGLAFAFVGFALDKILNPRLRSQ